MSKHSCHIQNIILLGRMSTLLGFIVKVAKDMSSIGDIYFRLF
jgi:hypothetical protein